MNNEDFYKRRVQNRKKQRQAEILFRLAISVGIVTLACLVLVIAVVFKKGKNNDTEVEEQPIFTRDVEATVVEKYNATRPDLQVELLTVNDYSRPGTALDEVTGIVIHWTANPGTTAIQNRSYFENLATTHETKASAHFVVGLEGEIVQCIPCSEMSYASNERNHDTISIECCISDEEGEFNSATYQSLVELTTWLMGRYKLTSDQVIRHYDVSGKDCPKYYVNNPNKWEKFLRDLDDYIEKNGVERDAETPQ